MESETAFHFIKHGVESVSVPSSPTKRSPVKHRPSRLKEFFGSQYFHRKSLILDRKFHLCVIYAPLMQSVGNVLLWMCLINLASMDWNTLYNFKDFLSGIYSNNKALTSITPTFNIDIIIIFHRIQLLFENSLSVMLPSIKRYLNRNSKLYILLNLKFTIIDLAWRRRYAVYKIVGRKKRIGEKWRKCQKQYDSLKTPKLERVCENSDGCGGTNRGLQES